MFLVECKPGTGMTMYAVWLAHQEWLRRGKPVISSNLKFAQYECLSWEDLVKEIEKEEVHGTK